MKTNSTTHSARILRKRWALPLLLLLLTVTSIAAQYTKPNILWITGEDISAKSLACYGNPHTKTPNFDKLAQDGFLYTHCFANVPVCAPSRSGWITGIYPTSSGTIYMRSEYPTPTSLIWYPDALRANGYYTANHHKTDYNTSNRKTNGEGGGGKQGSSGQYAETWDSYANEAWLHPRRKPNQPFFQVNNAAGCHESHLHRKHNTNNGIDPLSMTLAAYHPDIPEIRMDYARLTAGIIQADQALGKILKKLENDGLAKNTIVIYSSDHGGIIGRSKRFLYDSGTHAALIIRIPEPLKHLWPAAKPGTPIHRLVSFIDMPKTWLSITGSTIPPEMQGRIFLGENTEPPAPFIFSARERMDEVPDMQRSVRDSQYLYIRSYEPYRPEGQYLDYLWNAPSMRAWEEAHLARKTNQTTGAFFRPKPAEQLFDCLADPNNVKNLAADPLYAARLKNLRDTLKQQQLTQHDCGFLPEGILAQRAHQHKTTIYQLIRDPSLYDQERYMQAADVANFATITDLPQLVKLLQSADPGERYWACIGCIQLGETAATPEVMALMEKLIGTATKDESTLDIRATAAFYLCQIDKKSALALQSLAEIILDAPHTAPGKGRAWANLHLLGKKAVNLPSLLPSKNLSKLDQSALSTFISRLAKNKHRPR